MSLTSTLKKKTSFLLIAGLLACLSLSSQAHATQITGIADENLYAWSPASWAAFDATGVQQVRRTVAWNVADGKEQHQGELTETASWINQAEARGLQVLVSFRVNWSENVAPPSSTAYLDAVYKFRQAFPQVAYYTAWNEPNHKFSFLPKANTNGNPILAAQYWIALNALCHSTNFPTNCTVIAGDFLEPSPANAETFKNSYVNPYKQRIGEAGVSPSAWAIHPYTGVETGNWGVFTNTFKPLTENKPIWFTEVGGMVCKNGSGYTAGNLPASLNFQNASAANLVNFQDAKVVRTYYYALGQEHDKEVTCPGFDSTLLGLGSTPRPSYKTVFPNAPKPGVQTTAASNLQSTQATLNGTANPNGLNTSYHFEYGPTQAYGSSTAPTGLGWNPGSVATSATISGLQPGTTYHYRVVATNVMGTSYGADQVVETLPTPRPALISHPTLGVIADWRGSDGNLYQTFYSNGEWVTFSPTWGDLPAGVTLAGNPALTSNSSQGVIADWRGSDGNLYQTFYSNGEWVTFSPTWGDLPAGVKVAGDPALISHPTLGVIADWRGSDGHLYQTFYSNGEWVTFSPTLGDLPAGVKVAGDPALISHPTLGVIADWRGSDGHLYQTFYSNGEWVTFSPTLGDLPAGVTLAGNPALTSNSSQGVIADWRGSDGHLYQTFYSNGEWVTFSPTWGDLPAGVKVAGDPALISHPTLGVIADWRGSDGHLYQTFYSNGEWVTFSPTLGDLPAGVTLAGNPALTFNSSQGVIADWRGSDRNLYQTYYSNGEWVTFSPTWGGTHLMG